MANLTRVQMLLEPKQHEELKRIAEERGTSVNAVAREAIKAGLEDLQNDAIRRQQVEAWRQLIEFGDELLRERGGEPFDVDIVADLNAMREERLEQIAPSHR